MQRAKCCRVSAKLPLSGTVPILVCNAASYWPYTQGVFVEHITTFCLKVAIIRGNYKNNLATYPPTMLQLYYTSTMVYSCKEEWL